jgi:hypothetical protein
VTSGRPGTASGDALAALSALAMGLQSAAVLSLAVTGIFTTAATATVIFVMRDLADRGGTQALEHARLAGVLVALCAGAPREACCWRTRVRSRRSSRSPQPLS